MTKDDKLINYIKALRQDLLDDVQKCVDNDLLVKYVAKHIPQIEILNKIIQYEYDNSSRIISGRDIKSAYCNIEDYKEFKVFGTQLLLHNQPVENATQPVLVQVTDLG